LSLVFAFIATALAQPVRIDPGDPPVNPGGISEGWQVLNIPNLPAGALLGDVWVSPDGKVYVWAKFPGSPAVMSDDPGEGEKRPSPPGGSKPISSALYRYDGMLWTVMLRMPGETANALYGSGGHVYISTTSPAGEVNVYNFNGATWSREPVPGQHLGQLHTFAGVPGNLYLKIDREVLHDTGSGFYSMYALPSDEPAVRGLVYTDAMHLYVMCPKGHYAWDSGTWTACDENYAFTDVQDAWGMRDASGALQMYAVGSNNQNNGLYVWKFTELNPVSHLGQWATVWSDPPGTGVPGVGHGQHLWGSAGNDIYATGVVAGKGELMRFDGFTWLQLSPPMDLGAMHGVSGNGDGVVWFSTESGQIVRFRRPEPAAVKPTVGTDAGGPMQAEVDHGALTVRYSLATTTPVTLGVYDLMGRQLGTVEEGIRTPGTHEASWNLGSLDSGIYFVKLRTRGTALTRRVVVIR
jgi:hypothetical protein